MQETQYNFNQLSSSIAINCKDTTLLVNLQKSINCLQTDEITYLRLMLSIYDLSNHHNLIEIKVKQAKVHPLSIRMKILVMRMICKIIKLVNHNQIQRQQPQIQREALEILIISIRICLDSTLDYFQSIVYFEKMCATLFEIYGGQIGDSLEVVYHLNKLDIMRIAVDSSLFDIEIVCEQLRWRRGREERGRGRGREGKKGREERGREVREVREGRNQGRNQGRDQEKDQRRKQGRDQEKYQERDQGRYQGNDQENDQCRDQKKEKNYQQIIQQCQNQNHTQIEQYFQYIALQISLKLLRKNANTAYEKLKEFLPKKSQQIIAQIRQGRNNNFGQIYELYWQISTNGIHSIDCTILQEFICRQHVHNNNEIFEVIILTNSPQLLEIWFQEANRKSGKCPNLLTAYQCYVSLLLNDQLDDSYISLGKQVILNLLRESKDSAIPIYSIVESTCQLIIKLVKNNAATSSILELFNGVNLINIKHNFTELNKQMIALQLYYQLLHHCASQETYKKCMKLNPNSQHAKMLQLCYQMQMLKSNSNISESSLKLINDRPQYALMFCQQSIIILNFPMQNFMKMPNTLELYSILFEENEGNYENMVKIGNHMELYLLAVPMSKLEVERRVLRNLKGFLINRGVQKQKQKINRGEDVNITLVKDIETNQQNIQTNKQENIFQILWLYCACLEKQPIKIKEQKFGITFNKFSKLLKLIDIVGMDSEMICVCEVLISKSCMKFKKQFLQSRRCSLQSGQLAFLQILYEKCQSWNKNRKSDVKSEQYLKFLMFQIFCMAQKQSEAESIIEQQNNPRVIKILSNSDVISRSLKLKLLRKMFRCQLKMQFEQTVTLNDLHELIVLSSDREQSKIYIRAAIEIFGEKGKKFISVLAQTNPNVEEVCLKMFEGNS